MPLGYLEARVLFFFFFCKKCVVRIIEVLNVWIWMNPFLYQVVSTTLHLSNICTCSGYGHFKFYFIHSFLCYHISFSLLAPVNFTVYSALLWRHVTITWPGASKRSKHHRVEYPHSSTKVESSNGGLRVTCYSNSYLCIFRFIWHLFVTLSSLLLRPILHALLLCSVAAQRFTPLNLCFLQNDLPSPLRLESTTIHPGQEQDS